jgi:hypothetical protein
MAGQCLGRPIPDRETLEREVAAWEAERTIDALFNRPCDAAPPVVHPGGYAKICGKIKK